MEKASLDMAASVVSPGDPEFRSLFSSLASDPPSVYIRLLTIFPVQLSFVVSA